MEHNPVCIIAGVGPGNGYAFAEKFSQQGYQVALIARDHSKLEGYTEQIENTHSFPCDLTDTTEVSTTIQEIAQKLGPPEVLIYNAGTGTWKDLDSSKPEDLEASWRLNVQGCFQSAQTAVPHMRELGSGNIVIIGATASLKGNVNTLPFAQAKAAQKSLAESMARQLGPQMIHVSLLVIDGVVETDSTREFLPDKPSSFFLQPDAIAETVYRITQQPSSAWTFQTDVRPYGESW